jgi:hypothetical protein
MSDPCGDILGRFGLVRYGGIFVGVREGRLSSGIRYLKKASISREMISK